MVTVRADDLKNLCTLPKQEASVYIQRGQIDPATAVDLKLLCITIEKAASRLIPVCNDLKRYLGSTRVNISHLERYYAEVLNHRKLCVKLDRKIRYLGNCINEQSARIDKILEVMGEVIDKHHPGEMKEILKNDSLQVLMDNILSDTKL